MPAISSLPGVKKIPRVNGGSSWFWVASQLTSHSRGFRPRTRLLWSGKGSPSADELCVIQQECALLRGNLLAWRATGKAPKPRLIKIGVVYFLADAEGSIKIGFSTDLFARIADLQIGSASELRLLGTLAASNRIEAELKHRFRDLRIRGEWHRPGKNLLDFIAAEARRTTSEAA